MTSLSKCVVFNENHLNRDVGTARNRGAKFGYFRPSGNSVLNEDFQDKSSEKYLSNPEKEMVFCKFWSETKTCKFGNACKFSHVEDVLDKVINLSLEDDVTICSKWKNSGWCDWGPKCQFGHPRVCATDNCRIKSNCNGYHPLSVCNIWVTKGWCFCDIDNREDKLSKFHPKLCFNVPKTDNDKECTCYRFHPSDLDKIKPGIRPDELRNVPNFTKTYLKKICAESFRDFLSIKDKLQLFFNEDPLYIGTFFDEISNYKRLDILENIFNDKRFERILKSFVKDTSYSPFNCLVWVKDKDRVSIGTILSMCKLLVEKGFKILTQNQKYKENVFETIVHLNNKILKENKLKLLEYFYSVGDPIYWENTFILMTNRKGVMNNIMNMNIYLYMFSKCPEAICKSICIECMKQGLSLKEEGINGIGLKKLSLFLTSDIPKQDPNNPSGFKQYWETYDLKNTQKLCIVHILNHILLWLDEKKINIDNTCHKNISGIMSFLFKMCYSTNIMSDEIATKIVDILLILPTTIFYWWITECNFYNPEEFTVVKRKHSYSQKKKHDKDSLKLDDYSKYIITNYLYNVNEGSEDSDIGNKKLLKEWCHENKFECMY